MDKESLQKKTVAELKEMAREIPDVKGLSSMKKDDLVELLLSRGDGGAPGAAAGKKAKSAAKTAGPAQKKPLGKGEIKQRIRELKEQKRDAISSQDRARARQCNRQIHDYKRQLRRLAREKKNN